MILLYLSFLFFSGIGSAEFYKFLGGKSFLDSRGSVAQIPVGTVLSRKEDTKNSIELSYDDPTPTDYSPNRKIVVHRSELKSFFEPLIESSLSDYETYLAKLKDLAIENSCSEIVGDVCNSTKASESPSREQIAALIRNCSPSSTPNIIRRANTLPFEDFLELCANPNSKADFKGADYWPAPIPFPFCNSEEEEILRKNEKIKHKAYLGACPEKSPSLQKIGLITPEPKCMLKSADKNDIKRIVLHHTEGAASATPKALFCEYAKGGYSDIPYHFFIARDKATKKWVVYEGRSLSHQGAHIRANLNADSIGIVIAGDYRPGGPTPGHPFASQESPPEDAIRLVQSLVASLRKEYPAIQDIQGHGEALYQGSHCHKDCPGPSCQFLVNQLRKKYFSSRSKR